MAKAITTIVRDTKVTINTSLPTAQSIMPYYRNMIDIPEYIGDIFVALVRANMNGTNFNKINAIKAVRVVGSLYEGVSTGTGTYGLLATKLIVEAIYDEICSK